MKRRVFENGEYYHIYNRGVDKRTIFSDKDDYLRFIESINEFNTTQAIGSLHENRFNLEVKPPSEKDKVVEIIAYCLNPNHYHLLVKQFMDYGIPKYMHKIGTGYSMYFNEKYERSGSLFQGTYKSIHVKSNKYLLYLSAYINKNFYIHGYTHENAGIKANEDNQWEYSSELDYLKKREGDICNTGIILEQFKNIKEYQDFMKEVASNSKDKKYNKELTIETLGG